MLVRLMSDLHLEFGPLDVPVLENEKDIVVVLAGDIGLADRRLTFAPFVRNMAARHRAVIYIPGNHEYYDSSLTIGIEKLKEGILTTPEYASYDEPAKLSLSFPDNLHIINNEVVVIDDVAFICATMWTNFNNFDQRAMYIAANGMNDYNLIRIGTKAEPYQRRLRPEAVYNEHMISKNFVFNAVDEYRAKGLKTFVVTHHALSERSIADQFKVGYGAQYNPCYASDYDALIEKSKPDVCVHGHTHVSFEYQIGETWVYCNPRGYSGHEANPKFDPNFIIEL